MAIQVNYDLDGELYTDAYVKIQKIVCGSITNEYLEEQEDGSQLLKYEKVPEHIAKVFVYADEVARNNNARPIHYFGIEFDYDINNGDNIYKRAYNSLKDAARFKEEQIKDV